MAESEGGRTPETIETPETTETPATAPPARAARGWTVLLVGGPSGVGKTVVARRLARRFGVALGGADDFRLVIERVTTPDQQPAIHALRAGGGGRSPEELCERWTEVARAVSSALEIVVAFHLATSAPIILEGDTLLPSLAAKASVSFLPVAGRMRSVFLAPPDEATLMRNAAARGRGFQFLSPDEQQRDVRRHWLYAEWLKREAESHRLPVLTVGAWDELEERIVAAVGPPAGQQAAQP